jgi:hypothetical protein
MSHEEKIIKRFQSFKIFSSILHELVIQSVKLILFLLVWFLSMTMIIISLIDIDKGSKLYFTIFSFIFQVIVLYTIVLFIFFLFWVGFKFYFKRKLKSKEEVEDE